MKTVLIVDDNTTLAYFTARSLQRDMKGIDVITAVSCQEAQAKAAQHSPSVIIADIMLPDGDGLKLVQDLSEQLPQMRVIIISGNELPGNISDRFFGCLKKPYGEDILLSLVRRALDKKATSDSVNSHDQADQDQSTPASKYDRHYVRNRFAALLAGIRALQADLNAEPQVPSAVRRLAEEHTDRLFCIATELAHIMNETDKRQRGSHG